MDRLHWGLLVVKQANKNALNLPFSEFMEKQAKVDPMDAAARLRHRRVMGKK